MSYPSAVVSTSSRPLKGDKYLLTENPNGVEKTLLKIASFTTRHFRFLDEHLRGGAHGIYRPTASLKSTCLRVPNLVYILFAGRFTYVPSLPLKHRDLSDN